MNNPDWNLIVMLCFIAVIGVGAFYAIGKTSSSASQDLKNALDTLKSMHESERGDK